MVTDAGLFFRDAGDLARQIQLTLSDSTLVARLRASALKRAESHYSRDAVTDAYEKLFREVAS